jgi:UDP-N-acetylenolpyruvoylglucosamine reductase
MEGLIGVPGTIGGALRMNAGAYGTQIGSYVREVEAYRAGDGRIEILKRINFSNIVTLLLHPMILCSR